MSQHAQCTPAQENDEIDHSAYAPGHCCALASAYPVVEDLLNADLSGADFSDWIGIRNFPRGLAERVQAVADFREKLSAEAQRYEEIRLKGAAVLSHYDITMSGSEELAVMMALSLVYSHVGYYQRCLEGIRQIAPGIMAFIDSGATAEQPQTHLAPVLVEDVQLALF